MSAPTGLQLTIAPSPARVDDPLTIVVAGARPGQTVTVRARMRDGLGRRWESHATFAADERGEIHVARQRPLAGTYEDPDPRGLLWSMRLAEGQAAGLLTSAAPLETEVVAESAQMSPATARVRRHFATPAVTRTEVRDNGLVASLALAYFRAEHLPESLVEIPLEYFEGAIRWLRAQPAVGTRPLGVMGGSRGGELALLLGATFSDFRAVVGNVPSGIVHAGIAGGARETHPRPAWTYRGQPVPFLSPRNAGQMASAPVTSAPLPLAPIFLRAMQDRAAVEAATIPVERINGPVLLISGQDDQMWPSPALAEIAMKRLAERRFRFPYAHLLYPGAGHVIGQPGMPSTVTASLHPLAGRWLAYGGNPKDNAAAAADSWPKIIAFFREALGAP
jgi:dienelactone hydrolase